MKKAVVENIVQVTKVRFLVCKEPKTRKMEGKVVANKVYEAVIGEKRQYPFNWGEPVGQCLISHKDHLYLLTYNNKVVEESYTVDGVPTAKEKIPLVESDSLVKTHDLEDIVEFTFL